MRAFILVYIALILTIVVGWWMNIADLLTGNAGEGSIFVCRIVGIFVAPLGAILGIFF